MPFGGKLIPNEGNSWNKHLHEAKGREDASSPTELALVLRSFYSCLV
jgi:hypothetical protein